MYICMSHFQKHLYLPGIVSFWTLGVFYKALFDPQPRADMRNNVFFLVYAFCLHGCFQKYGYPKMDGLQWKTPIKMDDLGVPLLLETPT